MTRVPETRFAQLGGADIAYQVVGDQGPDLLFTPGPQHPIDLIWEEPAVAGYLRRLASFSRLILTDLLGGGSSDRMSLNHDPVMQTWTDGLVAVLDAARLMGERKIRHLPVVEGDHLLGMVGIRDVLGSLVERLWQSRDSAAHDTARSLFKN